MSNVARPGRWKPRYDLYDLLPEELRAFLQQSAFNWGSEFVYRKYKDFGSVSKTLRSIRAKEARRVSRDAGLIWRR